MRTKRVCAFGFMLFAVFGCSFEPYTAARAKPITGSQHEYLALLKAAGGYDVSEEKLESMITALLNPKSEGRSAAASKKVTITGSKKLPLAKKQKTSGARSAAAGEQDSVEVYAFTTENADGMEGYVLASTDMRIGNIIAVVDGKTLDDEPEWFSDIIFDGLAAYIEYTSQEYESISEKEIQEALENKDLRSTAPPVNTTPGSGSGEPADGVKGLIHHWYPNAANVVWAGWTWWDAIEHFVPVNWHQGNPYNYYVNRAKNGATMETYRTGCGPVAVAQVLAYYGWPEKCEMNGTIPNTDINIKNYVYNWTNMRNDFAPVLPDSITGGAKDIAVLMYHIGKAVGLTYNAGSTTSTLDDVLSAFGHMRYWTSGGFVSYDLNKIRSSLASGWPIVAYGSKDLLYNGHFWVIDGIRRMNYTERLSNGAEWQWDDRNFVHCNVGWGDDLNKQGLEYYKINNAWYISELFDFGDGRHALVRSTLGNYYQYYLKILPYLYPVK